MKLVSLITCLFVCVATFAQPQQSPSLEGKVYTLDAAKATLNTKNKIIFNGSSAVLGLQEMELVTLRKKESSNYVGGIVETFLIIKKGPAKVTLQGKSVSVDRGSVVLLLPGDKGRIENEGSDDVEFYQMTYLGTANAERGKKSGESFVMDWKDMVFKPTDKGGVRQLFDRQTAMLNRFDIHVTQLNEGNKSHDPHQHKNEEIILMLDGNAEMQIGTDHQKANPGDVVFLSSNILHNLTNIGKGACLYFAIQWN